MINDDKVSIITPSYNSELYIKKAIYSVLFQTYNNWEMIIVDDLSTDNSVNLIEEFCLKDTRIKLIKLKKNSGAGVARNIAIKKASGRFIAFLDGDDYWHKDKLKKQVEFLLSNNFSFVYSQYYVFKNVDNPIYIIKSPKEVNYKKMLNNDYIGCLTAMYDAHTLGKEYMPKIRKRQDWVLWLKLLKKVDKAYGLQEPLAYYRIGNSSLSTNKIKLFKHNFNVYYKELNMSYLKSVIMMINFLLHYFYFKKTSKKKVN